MTLPCLSCLRELTFGVVRSPGYSDGHGGLALRHTESSTSSLPCSPLKLAVGAMGTASIRFSERVAQRAT